MQIINYFLTVLNIALACLVVLTGALSEQLVAGAILWPEYAALLAAGAVVFAYSFSIAAFQCDSRFKRRLIYDSFLSCQERFEFTLHHNFNTFLQKLR
jgi:hypothetical protein